MKCEVCRYVLQGSRWRVSDLTYRVTKYPSSGRLNKEEVRSLCIHVFWQNRRLRQSLF